ncbi:MAG: dolichyl-phosphate beta-glucosyltransferase [Chloroflexota bacterium]
MPLLSIILPAHNEEKRLPGTLDRIFAFLQTQSYEAEVIVVENGSQDHTLAIAQEYARRYPALHVLQNRQRGKGLAVRAGMLAAAGDYRFMCDVDLSMPIEEINRFLPPAIDGCHVAIASREGPGAVRYDEPPYRHFVGRVYNTIIRILALPGLQDTQCGFKCFSAQATHELFLRQTLTGWSFDVELLYIARRRGYCIVEIGIPWYFNADSKIRVLHDSLRMFLDLLTIRWNGLRGVYDRPL